MVRMPRKMSFNEFVRRMIRLVNELYQVPEARVQIDKFRAEILEHES